MTHTTDVERALFEAVASDDGKWPQAIERDAKGNYLLMQTAQGWRWWQEAWQAARRAQLVPEVVKAQDIEEKIGELLALARIMVSAAMEAGHKAEMQEIKTAIEAEVAFERALRNTLAAAPLPPEEPQ